MPWALNTNAAKKLKEIIETFATSLHEQFPDTHHVLVTVGKGGNAGIRVEIYSKADERQPHFFRGDDGKQVAEEYHRLAIDVKADSKNGGAPAAEEVYGVLRLALLSEGGRASLIDLGVYDVRETPEAPDYGDVQFERALHMSCNTETFLS